MRIKYKGGDIVKLTKEQTMQLVTDIKESKTDVERLEKITDLIGVVNEAYAEVGILSSKVSELEGNLTRYAELNNKLMLQVTNESKMQEQNNNEENNDGEVEKRTFESLNFDD